MLLYLIAANVRSEEWLIQPLVGLDEFFVDFYFKVSFFDGFGCDAIQKIAVVLSPPPRDLAAPLRGPVL